MKRSASVLALALSLLCARGFAQAPAPDANSLPAGHPSLNQPPADSSEATPTVPSGSIRASIVDEQGVAQPNVQVRLGILFQKIAEGESRSERFTHSDANGIAIFSDLTSGSERAYRVTVPRGAATYSSTPFNLRADMGQQVLLHLFPVTSEIERAMVGLRGFVYIQPRDEVFQFEVLFKVFNVGLVTWVPNAALMQLPRGFKAFKAQEGMTDVRFEADAERGALLKGTITPGEHDVSFRFQIPKESDETVSFHMGLPPHVAEMRVIAEASPNMTLDVEGFETARVDRTQNGDRVLVTRKQLKRQEDEQRNFTIAIGGLPVPGPGRWIAVLLSLGFVVGGVFGARGAFDDKDEKVAQSDRAKARELLLADLVELEHARQAQRIGPHSYEQGRSALIDAIARLGTWDNKRPHAKRLDSRKRGKRSVKSEA
ncbi:MAG TPA: carboxypeptidase-like regulatory domain-containing protein [Polyangiaceae bacterium]|jgi:hypothetical protein